MSAVQRDAKAFFVRNAFQDTLFHCGVAGQGQPTFEDCDRLLRQVDRTSAGFRSPLAYSLALEQAIEPTTA